VLGTTVNAPVTNNGSPLAFTGSRTGIEVLLGFGLLVFGAGLLAGARRKRSTN
jgi:hypothetical protein